VRRANSASGLKTAFDGRTPQGAFAPFRPETGGEEGVKCLDTPRASAPNLVTGSVRIRHRTRAFIEGIKIECALGKTFVNPMNLEDARAGVEVSSDSGLGKGRLYGNPFTRQIGVGGSLNKP